MEVLQYFYAHHTAGLLMVLKATIIWAQRKHILKVYARCLFLDAYDKISNSNMLTNSYAKSNLKDIKKH